jgi:hypothetical protein
MSLLKPEEYDSEEQLCMAYVKSGIPLRTAAQLALDNFVKRDLGANEEEATQHADDSAAAAGAGAGAGSA